MKANTGVLSLFVGLSLFSAATLPAQTQPPQAVNQQDEVITISLDASQGPEDVVEILRSGDKFETNKYITRAFEIRNTPAYELQPYILTAVSQEKGTVRSAKTSPTDGSPVRQFLVVTTTPAQLNSVEETIAALDVPGFVNSGGTSRKAIRLKYRLASDLGTILRNTRLTSQGKVFADDLTNTLYYDDSVYVTGEVESYVQFFDVPVPQIEFDVQIIEVREDDSEKLGLDWDAWKRGVGGQFVLSGNSFEGGDQFARLDSLLTLDAAVLANFLNYTVQNGNARLVQRSRLNASNLEPAVISDVKRVPYHDYQRTERDPKLLTEVNPRVDTASEYDGDEPPATVPRTVTIVPPVFNRLVDLSSEEEGLLINIQPVIATETVTARIDIAVNTVVAYDQIGRPIVAEQDLTNQFTLQDGRELLLGTLERETEVRTHKGIPGLKDLPVVGYAFGTKGTSKEKSRLFILATPTFSQIGFDARSLAELKEKPALRIEEREAILDDGGLADASGKAGTP